MIGDLHCHTRLSDGSSSIEDLIFYAKRAGMDFVALTDHDTMAGTTRAAVLGQRYGIVVLPGAELSAWDNDRGRKVHVLCYLPRKPQRLLSICSKVLESRARAGQEMVRRAMTYYPVTAEHIARHASGSKAIYKVHIMHALMDLGYTGQVYGELYHRLFDSQNGLCFVPTEYPEVHTIIDSIHSAGGIAVMAHPTEFHSLDLLEDLAKQRLLDGVEVHHPRCSPEAEVVIGGIANRYGLIQTGGSDFHGYYASCPNPVGSCITVGEEIDKLFHLSKKTK